MDFTKLIDRFGKIFQNIRQSSSQTSTGATTGPAGPENSPANSRGQGGGDGASGELPPKPGMPAVPYPTQQILHPHHHHSQPPPQYSLPLSSPAPPPPTGLPLTPSHQHQYHPQHHPQQQHSTSTTPSPAYPQSSQSSSSISSIPSPLHYHYPQQSQSQQHTPHHPPLTGVASSSGGVSSVPLHHHPSLQNCASQPIMNNSGGTANSGGGSAAQSSTTTPNHHPHHHHHHSQQSHHQQSQHHHNCSASSSVTSPHYPFSIGSRSTSNSPSSLVSPTPPPPHSAGPHGGVGGGAGLPPTGSYSAAQTPESPSLTGFRRQLSLNIFQRERHLGKANSGAAGGGLHLDFVGRGGSVKGGGVISNNSGVSPFAVGGEGTNALIDYHSLSPRPRPKNLGLSNSHDNISKNMSMFPSSGGGPVSAGQSDRGGGGGPFSGGFPPANASARHHRSGFAFNFSPSSGGGGGCAGGGVGSASGNHLASGSGRSQFYPNPVPSTRLKEEFANKNNRTIKINGKKYENIKEEDFRKISELGSGSFGQVEKMHHKGSNTELAVKKMRRSGNQDDNRHIINDLELLRKCLDFANIVQCYGYYIMETEVWIFMELMTTCFDRLLKRLKEPVPEKIIGKIAVATVSTLNYLKINHGVIHRDIKPSNILINRQGIIKLCDFGISGRLIDSKAHSRSVGCAAYMAPERIQPPDSTGTYDIRSDVWSMGITLVEIATGKFPYDNFKSDFELLSKVIQEAPPTLPAEAGFSPDFINFIKCCLTKDYAKRPKYKELMDHAFYTTYHNTPVDVAEWFRNAYDEADSTKSSTSSLASAKFH